MAQYWKTIWGRVTFEQDGPAWAKSASLNRSNYLMFIDLLKHGAIIIITKNGDEKVPVEKRNTF